MSLPPQPGPAPAASPAGTASALTPSQRLRLALQQAWRGAWGLLPDWVLPLRIRLAGLARSLLGEPPTGRYDPEDRRGYARWIARFDTLAETDRAAIRAHIAAMPAPPLISVVMPAYETPELLLRAAIASVRAQLWPHWELCIADDASPSPHVARVLAEIAAEEPRLRWVRRERNGHISAASNSALALARGDYVALLDHDDLLAETALYEVAAAIEADPEAAVLYSDEDKLDAEGQRFGAYFKPDFDPDLLLGQNFVSHLGVYRRDLLERLGGLREGLEGSQDHDLALRAAAAVGPARVRHIPAILYHWRQTGQADSFSQAQLDRCTAASRRAVADLLAAQGVAARLEPSPLAPTHTRVVWPLPEPAPLVSVIVPTRDRAGLLAACAEGVLEKTDYPAIELLIVDNGSEEAETLALFVRLRADPRVRILASPGPFNYAALNNQAAAAARGELLLLLNNDIEVIEPGWLRELASQAMRPEVGAVGARLLYADGRLQHGGVVIGVGGVADHYLLRSEPGDSGYFGSLALVREVAAVTGACLALRKSVFEAVGGLDAQNLAVAFNDIDLCLRIREAGWRILWTPFAALHHLESASRGKDHAPEKARRFAGEIAHMKRRWGEALLRDPFYSRWMSLDGAHCALARAPRRAKPWAAYMGGAVSRPRPAMPLPPAPRAAPASQPVPPRDGR
ncbi:glycosyltransferase family 2 protein [Roseicella frigidaeris]|uniref:Glycosyltransferase family 2 protein n=1 Tax=Roseicella frigidaeris TaxID=2230885 RepID=A0A327M4N1_9PROT|nr:glycosyltransferase [Roseicella frigidaeris]RAI57192.1 glycosyltransferase family 2 protein [Roseicella frigidaeris]